MLVARIYHTSCHHSCVFVGFRHFFTRGYYKGQWERASSTQMNRMERASLRREQRSIHKECVHYITPPSVSRHVSREIVWKMDMTSRASGACGGGSGWCNSLWLTCSGGSTSDCWTVCQVGNVRGGIKVGWLMVLAWLKEMLGWWLVERDAWLVISLESCLVGD